MTVSENKYAFNDGVITKDYVKLSFKSLKTLEEERIDELEKRIGELENEIDFLNYLLTKHGRSGTVE